MTTAEMIKTIREIKELELMASELNAEIEALKDTVKAEMTAEGKDTMTVDCFKVSYKTVSTATTQAPIISMSTGDLNRVIPLMFMNPIISDYINRFNPINEKCISNECYRICYDDYDNTTRIMVYLNPDYVANIRKKG